MPCGQSFKDDIWLSFRNDICTLSLKWYMTVSSKGATAPLNHFEMIYLLSLWNDISKETVFCTPLACSECLPIESWPNSIGKHPAEKIVCYLFEMTNDYPFKMSNTVLCSFRYDIWLSFRNDGAKIFVQRMFFINSLESNSRDENAP